MKLVKSVWQMSACTREPKALRQTSINNSLQDHAVTLSINPKYI